MKENLNRLVVFASTFILVLFLTVTVASVFHYMTFYNNSSIGGFIFSYIIHAPSNSQLFECIYILGYLIILFVFRNNHPRQSVGFAGLLGFGLLTLLLNPLSFQLNLTNLTNSITMIITRIIPIIIYSLRTAIINAGDIGTDWLLFLVGLFVLSILSLAITFGLKLYRNHSMTQSENRSKIKFKRPQRKTVIEVILATLLVSSLFIVIALITLRLTNIVNV